MLFEKESDPFAQPSELHLKVKGSDPFQTAFQCCSDKTKTVAMAATRAAPAISQQRIHRFGKRATAACVGKAGSSSKIGAAVVTARVEPQPGHCKASTGTSVLHNSQAAARLALAPIGKGGRRRSATSGAGLPCWADFCLGRFFDLVDIGFKRTTDPQEEQRVL